MPELRQIRAFVAVAQQLSFTRAAETLEVRQQTVSKSIRDLETELGVELLSRTTREVRLTDAGLSLLEPARESLRRLEDAFETTRAVGEGRLGVLRIGVTPSIAATDTGEVARAIRAHAAEMNLSFREIPSADLRQALYQREVDIALSRTVGNGDPALHKAVLRPTPAAVFVSSDHPLADRKDVSLADLDGSALLAVSPRGTAYTDFLVDRFGEAGAGIEVREARVIGGSSSMLTELVGTDAFAVKPAAIEPPPGVARLELRHLDLPLQVLWPAGLPSKAALWLRDMLGLSKST
jgi:DNA-binding transcriptional LysR family regulator